VFYINLIVSKSRENLIRKRYYHNSEIAYYNYGFVVITIAIGKITFTTSNTIYGQIITFTTDFITFTVEIY